MVTVPYGVDYSNRGARGMAAVAAGLCALEIASVLVMLAADRFIGAALLMAFAVGACILIAVDSPRAGVSAPIWALAGLLLGPVGALVYAARRVATPACKTCGRVRLLSALPCLSCQSMQRLSRLPLPPDSALRVADGAVGVNADGISAAPVANRSAAAPSFAASECAADASGTLEPVSSAMPNDDVSQMIELAATALFGVRIIRAGRPDTLHALSRASTRIGRSSIDNQVVLEGDGLVSRSHAELTLREGQLYVRDLGSTNGTHLLSEGHTRGVGEITELAIGDTLLIGESQLVVAAIGIGDAQP